MPIRIALPSRPARGRCPRRRTRTPSASRGSSIASTGRMWLCAGRAEELPSTGYYFLRRVGAARVIVVRGEEGRIHAFHDSCRHRGTTLVAGGLRGALPVASSAPITAGRTGSTEGSCSAPHGHGGRVPARADFPLRRVATGEWDGHVFINLAEDPAPLAQHLADLPEKFRPWRMEELRRVERRSTSSRPTGSSWSRTSRSASTAPSPIRSSNGTRIT